jgi:hypothetical protein
MPAISSDTLFHFTNKENLLGILENEFYPRFSLEHYQIDETTSFAVGLPMVSFCDIPLSLVHRHMTKYGNYGIGMSKEWAERSRLNPVLYLRKGSQTTRILGDVITGIAKDVREVCKVGIEIESLTEQRDLLFKLFTYTKPFYCLTEESEITKYYDEREWRYVPDPSSYDCVKIMLTQSEFKDPILSEENEKLKNAKLCFQPSDINYIIIKDESERLDLIKEIGRIKGKHDSDTQSVLLSKIISAEQILQDF